MSKRAGVRRLCVPLVAAVAVTMSLVFGGTARASSTIAVHTTAQLVAAVASGSPGDIILLDSGVQYSPAASLDVSRNLTIQTDPAQIALGGRAGIISGGSMTGSSGLDPGGNLDILVVGAAQTLTLHNVVVTAAIQPSNGAVVVMGPAPAGGNGGTLSVDHSLVSANTSNGVDVMAGGQATITNSTIASSIGGDGILLDGNGTFNQDTIANNAFNGIDNHGGGVATVRNTILSGNGSGNCFFPITGAAGTGSNSDDSATSCGATITTGGASSTGTGVIAASLANNGGPTNTYALPAASVAVGHGTGAGAAPDDQRGFLRDAAPDVGAYELNGAPPATLTVIKHVVGPGSPSNFQINVTGAGANPSTFTGQDTPGTQVTVASGQTYSIGETMVGGGAVTDYTSSQSGNCTGPIAAGATGSCTITNTAKPAQLTVIKHVDNTGCVSGCGAALDFTMTVKDTTTNTTVASFPGAETPGSPPVAITAGDSYMVTEQADAAQNGKYIESDGATCSGTATANGAVTCTITNTYIQCQQPGNSGPQNTPGGTGSSANTCVNENVLGTILVTAPVSITFQQLGAGEDSSPVAGTVNVKSNDPAGYQLSVTRTKFTNTPAGNDLTLSIQSAPVSAPQVFDPVSFPGGALTPILAGSNLSLGSTSAAITSASGDDWPFSFVLHVPFGVSAGQHQSVMTFTGIGK